MLKCAISLYLDIHDDLNRRSLNFSGGRWSDRLYSDFHQSRAWNSQKYNLIVAITYSLSLFPMRSS